MFNKYSIEGGTSLYYKMSNKLFPRWNFCDINAGVSDGSVRTQGCIPYIYHISHNPICDKVMLTFYVDDSAIIETNGNSALGFICCNVNSVSLSTVFTDRELMLPKISRYTLALLRIMTNVLK